MADAAKMMKIINNPRLTTLSVVDIGGLKKKGIDNTSKAPVIPIPLMRNAIDLFIRAFLLSSKKTNLLHHEPL